MELVGASTGQSSGQVWIENHPTEGWVPGRVDSLAPNGNYRVVDERGEQFEIPQEKARPVDQACLRGVDDLLDLGDFNEGALLHNIRVRYFRDEIYTGIGGPILISINPYLAISGLYGDAKQKFYRDHGAALNSGDAKIPPHLFSVGAASYMSMLKDSKDQSIIISGESGAGKTEATKRILTYFANLQSDQGGGARDDCNIAKQVMNANPILEAFGNAKTIRNDNSSRFGKFMEIEFDTLGKLRSARISNYLLEKCRIVTQQPNERGYHAFYQLCAGAASLPDGVSLGLLGAGQHTYTCGLTEVAGVDDMADFDEMVTCMISMGFSDEERTSVFKIVAAVLHLGDMGFEEGGTNEGCKISDEQLANQISSLLDVDPAKFKKIYTYKTLEDPFTKKIIDMDQDVMGASNTRHSMAKVAYSRLFDWLVWRINQSTMAKATEKGNEIRRIGILDIYGFEVFDWNSFEQLCINFANEKLQQHFNSHMFTLEQQLYTEEGITWSHIVFQDNKEIIDCIEKKPLGLFCIIDSECLMPNATDQTCLSKIYNAFKTSKICYKPSLFASTNFAVAHYAGEVIYDVVSFLEKNTDKLHADIMNLLKTSSSNLLATLFTSPLFAPELAAPSGAAAGRPGAAGAAALRRPGADGGGRAKQNVTVSMAFRQQLDKLVVDLNKTSPRYIRCIKPNACKEAHTFDSVDVQRQLRCAGMLESIRIRRAGYSVRRPFKEFFNRYRVLSPQLSTAGQTDPDYKELVRRLLNDMEAKILAENEKLEPKSWQVGRSKIFLKDEIQAMLEKRIGTAVAGYVIKIQKLFRGYRQKKRYKAMRRAGLAIQASLRTLRAAATFRVERLRLQACLSMQAAFRTMVLRSSLLKKRRAAVTVQRIFRGWRWRRKIGKLKGKKAEERIQKLREEEARGAALETANKVAQERERALAEMQGQLESERKRAQQEAQKQLEENQVELERTRQAQISQAAQAAQAAQVEGPKLEQMRQDLLEAKKQNARLQGQLECTSMQQSSTSDAEVEQLRRELQDLRRDKVRIEVELSTAKSHVEFDALTAEIATIREECSSLRRGKMDAELQLEQRSAALDSAQSQAARSQQASVELDVLRSAYEELQIQAHKLQAQKSTLEARVQGAEAMQTELRDMRLERMRLQGDLETSKLLVEAMAERHRGAEKLRAELQQQRQNAIATDTELEASRAQVTRLQQQFAKSALEDNMSRTTSLDQLRSELLSRIQIAPVVPSARPSIVHGGLQEERGTLMNQREMFEKIKQQFKDSSSAAHRPDDAAIGEVDSREAELEEEVRHVRKESVELNIRITSMQDELRVRDEEVGQHRRGNATYQAEIQDLKHQLESETSSTRYQAIQAAEMQDHLGDVERDLVASRGRVDAAELRAARAEEDFVAAQQRAARQQHEQETMELQLQDLRRQAAEASSRDRAMDSQAEEQRQQAEHFRKVAEGAERARVQGEASVRWLESDNERMRAEVAAAQAERAKISEVVDELVRAEGQSKIEELQRDVEQWKREYTRAKQLNQEMTREMSQMLQSVTDRTDESGDLVQQNRLLKKQLEAKAQEVRAARNEKDETQQQLDSLQTTGTYFQEKYREVSTAMRTLQQEHSVSSASASKLKARVESMQKENDDLKAQCGKFSMEARAGAGDTARMAHYEQHVRELQQKMRAKDVEVQDTREKFQKSQVVNTHLNDLLALESEQASLYESYSSVHDEHVRSELANKKSKAKDVISRLHAMLNEDERQSISGLNITQPAYPSGVQSGLPYRGGLDQTWAG